MIERPNVDSLLAGELGQWLSRQVGVRDEAREKSNKRIVIAAFIVLPLLGLLWAIPFLNGPFGLFVAGILLMGAAWWCYAPRAKAIKETKIGINNALAKALGLSFQHDPMESLSFDLAKIFSMLPNHSRARHEDLWSGDVAGRPFSLHESHLQQKKRSGKRTRWVTVFRGAIMTISCPGLAQATTLIERAKKHRKFLGFGATKDSVKFDGIHLDVVDMVHPDFEDAFSVWSNDQVEARVLIDPLYVEKLVALESAFSGKNVRTLFHQGELLIVIEASDMFESGNMNAARDRELIETTVTQFMSLVELADSLSPDQR